MLNKFLVFLILPVALGVCPISKKAEKSLVHEEIRGQIERADCDDADRLGEVRKLFREAGAEPFEIKTEKFEKFQNVRNVSLTLEGKSKETIVVGAHFDKTTLGCGAIDNWSGVVLVANFYKSLKNVERNKTIRFVAFGKEEKGLLGSKAFVENLSENEKRNLCAMINFDSFGFANLWTLETISDEKLIEEARRIARDGREEFAVKNFPGAVSDSKSFREAGIPAITFSGLEENWKEYLHQEKDRSENIDFEKIQQNFEFSLRFIKAAEARPCGFYR